MRRYVTIPEDVVIHNPVTDKPLKEPGPDGEPAPVTFSFLRSARIALLLASHTGEFDVESLHDLKKRIEYARAGDVLDLSETEWKVLEPQFRRPNANAFGSCWAMGGGQVHSRAWTHAPTEDPRRASNGAHPLEALEAHVAEKRT